MLSAAFSRFAASPNFASADAKSLRLTAAVVAVVLVSVVVPTPAAV